MAIIDKILSGKVIFEYICKYPKNGAASIIFLWDKHKNKKLKI